MANGNMTRVYLLNVPLENDYKNTLYFTSKANQQLYFESRIVKSYTDFSYQRKENFIRVPEHFDNLQGVNYVMYQNTAYSNKWYYAFITDMKYIDEGRTDVYIETDYIQTWLFDYNVKASFVEREHVADDTIGLHIQEEGLQLGEYICNKHTQAEYGGFEGDELQSLTKLSIVVGVTKDKEGKNVSGMLYTNIYSGLYYYSFENNADGVKELNNFIEGYGDGKAEAIVCMFLAPQEVAPVRTDNFLAGGNLVRSDYINREGKENDRQIEISTKQIDGYTPKNNKLLTHPFRYMIASNNCGTDVVYKYEDFYTKDDENNKIIKDPSFKIEGCVTPGCSVRMVPLNFKGDARNDIEGINLGKYPCLNWTSDIYTNWLTQNGVNIGIQVASSLVSGIAGVATGNALGVAAGVIGVAHALGEVHKASFTPPQAQGNINCGDVVTASHKNDFHFYDMTIKKQFAEIIDGYFSMYGYRVNMIKVPNKAHRGRWWYTKTIDVNIDGAIPNKDLQVIKDCYNKGITFWRNASEIQDYSLDNDVIA